MCFSASVSFIVGGSLAISGVVLLQRAKNSSRLRKYIPLASFPLVFGLQQIVEGFTWLELNGPTCLVEANLPVYAYIFFSHVFWPIFVPLSIYVLEPKKTRRYFVGAFLVIGILTSLSLLRTIIESSLSETLTACTNGLSIVYRLSLPHPYLHTFFYFMASVGSLLLASDRRINYLGLALFISQFIALMFFYEAHLSVWCFFGALLSIMIFKIVRPS